MGVTLHTTSDPDYYNDLWEYSQTTNSWSQKAYMGIDRWVYAIGFAVDNLGYIGTGSITYTNDIWQYDPSVNSWSHKTSLPGAFIRNAAAFSINGKGYVGTGGFSSLSNDFWQYDPASDTWTQKATFGGAPRHLAVGFSIGSKGYIGTGDTSFSSSYTNDFWEYDSNLNSWTRKADFAGRERGNAVAFSIGNKGYIGTASYPYTNDFWEYTPDSVTGINELVSTALTFQLYPNPASKILTINERSSCYSKILINILDINGKEIISKSLDKKEGSFEIDVSSLSTGIYFLELNASKARGVQRFMKD